MSSTRTTTIALTIAGSDSGGGAGIQADIKTFSALGVYGASVITATTAQNTRIVADIFDLPIPHIIAQCDAVFDDLDVCAIKTGMLGKAEVVRALAARLRQLQDEGRQLPIVVDPVMVAKSGDMLLAADAVDALVSELLPLATLITPNLPEAFTILAAADRDESVRLETLLRMAMNKEDVVGAMTSIARTIAGASGVSVLLKGGHLPQFVSVESESDAGSVLIDLLWSDGNAEYFESRRIATSNTHGTGCTLSAAIAAGLAKGESLSAAVKSGRRYLHAAIAAADSLKIGSGHGPVHHFSEIWPGH